MRRALGFLLLIVALVLFGLDVAGMVTPPREHPKLAQVTTHKNGVTPISYPDSLGALSGVDATQSEFERLRQITEIFARRIVHYWPLPGKTDSEVLYSPLENWYVAGLQRLEMAREGLSMGKIDLARLERRDYRMALAKGVGFCSQASLALVDYLSSIGIPAKILSLGRHVVVMTTLNGKSYLLDPDYNVAFATPSENPTEWRGLARQVYADAGYSGAELEKVVAIYADTKTQGPIDRADFTPGWRRTLISGGIAKWAVPALLFAGGLWLLRGRAVSRET